MSLGHGCRVDSNKFYCSLEILLELGYSESESNELIDANVVRQAE